MARKRISKRAVEEALREAPGVLAQAARALGVTRTSMYRIVERYGLKPLLEELRDELLDLAEARLFEAVARGEGWAITFTLRTLGCHRGYAERIEAIQSTELRVHLVETPLWGQREE